ncbi:MAG TPA: class I SAM-dependent methyltransferase [Thermoanaerobaculia bacterium]
MTTIVGELFFRLVAIHPLVEDLLASRRTRLPDGTETAADSFIPRDECELIYETIAANGATKAIEVGMAFGVSSLCIADALHRNGADARLVTIDPHQTAGWRSAGMHLVARAAYDSMVTLIEEPSQTVLPQLARDGRRFDFAFIDGWHTFDHTLVDFFFIDLMLETGGCIVLDDVGYPAVNAVVRFILANRDYELLQALRFQAPVATSLRLRREIKRRLRPIARTDRDPKPEHDALFRSIENVHAVALRKRGEDARRFDHYERF